MKPACLYLWSLLSIVVQVHNEADIARESLTAAQKEVARIFTAAGIGIVWLECPSEATCAQPCSPSRFDLWIAAGVRTGDEKTTVGVARSSGAGAGYVTVFYPRIVEFAKQGTATQQQILGHVIAHEIGHQLLGSKPHAGFGIMRGQWAARDLRAAAMGALLFSPGEAALMRSAVGRQSGCQ